MNALCAVILAMVTIVVGMPLAGASGDSSTSAIHDRYHKVAKCDFGDLQTLARYRKEDFSEQRSLCALGLARLERALVQIDLSQARSKLQYFGPISLVWTEKERVGTVAHNGDPTLFLDPTITVDQMVAAISGLRSDARTLRMLQMNLYEITDGITVTCNDEEKFEYVPSRLSLGSFSMEVRKVKTRVAAMTFERCERSLRSMIAIIKEDPAYGAWLKSDARFSVIGLGSKTLFPDHPFMARSYVVDVDTRISTERFKAHLRQVSALLPSDAERKIRYVLPGED